MPIKILLHVRVVLADGSTHGRERIPCGVLLIFGPNSLTNRRVAVSPHADKFSVARRTKKPPEAGPPTEPLRAVGNPSIEYHIRLHLVF